MVESFLVGAQGRAIADAVSRLVVTGPNWQLREHVDANANDIGGRNDRRGRRNETVGAT
jgi:hypothetical protein